MKSRLGIITLLYLLWAAVAGAQNTSTYGTITAGASTCTPTSCVYYQVPLNTPWVVLNVSGTWSGTLQVQTVNSTSATTATLNNYPWTLISTLTANDNRAIAVGSATFILVNASALASGAAQVTMAGSQSGTPLQNPVFTKTVGASGIQIPSGGSSANCFATDGSILTGCGGGVAPAGQILDTLVYPSNGNTPTATATTFVPGGPRNFQLGGSSPLSAGGYTWEQAQIFCAGNSKCYGNNSEEALAYCGVANGTLLASEALFRQRNCSQQLSYSCTANVCQLVMADNTSGYIQPGDRITVTFQAPFPCLYGSFFATAVSGNTVTIDTTGGESPCGNNSGSTPTGTYWTKGVQLFGLNGSTLANWATSSGIYGGPAAIAYAQQLVSKGILPVLKLEDSGISTNSIRTGTTPYLTQLAAIDAWVTQWDSATATLPNGNTIFLNDLPMFITNGNPMGLCPNSSVCSLQYVFPNGTSGSGITTPPLITAATQSGSAVSTIVAGTPVIATLSYCPLDLWSPGLPDPTDTNNSGQITIQGNPIQMVLDTTGSGVQETVSLSLFNAVNGSAQSLTGVQPGPTSSVSTPYPVPTCTISFTTANNHTVSGLQIVSTRATADQAYSMWLDKLAQDEQRLHANIQPVIDYQSLIYGKGAVNPNATSVGPIFGPGDELHPRPIGYIQQMHEFMRRLAPFYNTPNDNSHWENQGLAQDIGVTFQNTPRPLNSTFSENLAVQAATLNTYLNPNWGPGGVPDGCLSQLRYKLMMVTGISQGGSGFVRVGSGQYQTQQGALNFTAGTGDVLWTPTMHCWQPTSLSMTGQNPGIVTLNTTGTPPVPTSIGFPGGGVLFVLRPVVIDQVAWSAQARPEDYPISYYGTLTAASAGTFTVTLNLIQPPNTTVPVPLGVGANQITLQGGDLMVVQGNGSTVATGGVQWLLPAGGVATPSGNTLVWTDPTGTSNAYAAVGSQVQIFPGQRLLDSVNLQSFSNKIRTITGGTVLGSPAPTITNVVNGGTTGGSCAAGTTYSYKLALLPFGNSPAFPGPASAAFTYTPPTGTTNFNSVRFPLPPAGYQNVIYGRIAGSYGLLAINTGASYNEPCTATPNTTYQPQSSDQSASGGNLLYGPSAPTATGQCALSVASGSPAVSWGSCGSGGSSPLTTKGDLFGFNTANARIPVGTNGQVLTADSTNALGVSWQAVSGSGNTTSTALTNTHLPAANGANSIVDSLFTDSGTSGSYSGTGGFTASAGPMTGVGLISSTTLTGHSAPLQLQEGTTPLTTGLANNGLMWEDGSHWIKFNANNFGIINIAGSANAGTPGDCVEYGSNGFILIDAGSACGSGSSGISGQASGVIPLASTATTIGAQSHLDDGNTTAGTITSTEPVNVLGDGVHAGRVGIYGNTTPPTLPANNFSVVGPNLATFTGFGWQAPNATNASAGLLHIGANSGGLSQMSISQVAIADLSATGTPSSTTYLRGDNTWATIAAGGDTITSPNSTLSVGGTATNTTLDLNLTNPNSWNGLQTFGLHASLGSAAHAVLLSENTSAIATAAPSAAGYPLTSNGSGSDPSFQLPYLPIQQVAELFEFGTSFTYGLGVNNPATSYASMIAAGTGAPYINLASSGQTSEQIVNEMFASFGPNPLIPSVTVVDSGPNDGTYDACGGTTTSACAKSFTYNMEAGLALASIPSTQRAWASTGTTSGGAWAADNTLSTFTPTLNSSPGTPYYTLTTNAQDSITISCNNCTTIGVTYLGTNSSAGSFSLSIDGTLQTDGCSSTTTFATAPCSGFTWQHLSNSFLRQQFTVTAANSHTIIYKSLSTTHAGFVAVDWNNPTGTQTPTNAVFAIGPNNYYQYASTYDTLMQTAATQINGITGKVFEVSQLSGTPGVNSTTDLATSATSTCSASNTAGHPNTCGEFHMYQTIHNVEVANSFQFEQYNYQAPVGTPNFFTPFSVNTLNAGARSTRYSNVNAGLVLGAGMDTYSASAGIAGIGFDQANQTGLPWTGQYVVPIYNSFSGGWTTFVAPTSSAATGGTGFPAYAAVNNGNGAMASYLKVDIPATITFAASLTIPITNTIERLTLTANVTSSTIAAGTYDGQRLCLDIAQNGTGSFTFSPPSNMHGFFSVGSTASKHNLQCFQYSNAATAWLAESLGITNE